MKLATEIARELFLYGPAGGRRVTSVNELVRLSGAGRRSIEGHMVRWKQESAELAASCGESGFTLSLTTDSLKAHKEDCDFLRSEVDRLKTHLRGLSPGDEAYCGLNRAMLATERQWATMSGIVAALDAAAARLKEKEKLEAKREEAIAAAVERARDRPRYPSGFARSSDREVVDVTCAG